MMGTRKSYHGKTRKRCALFLRESSFYRHYLHLFDELKNFCNTTRKGVRNGEEGIGSFVPCQIVIASSQNIHWTRVEVIQHLLKSRTHALLCGRNRSRKSLPGEQKQMSAFIGRQPERLRQTF